MGKEHVIEIQTFGNFDIFVDGKLVKFPRKKAKELLAYLVDRRGSSITTAEGCSVLWEELDDKIAKDKYQHTKRDLRKVLREYDIEELLICQWNGLAIDTRLVNCDYYQYLSQGNTNKILYLGEYMSSYSWAEYTAGYLASFNVLDR